MLTVDFRRLRLAPGERLLDLGSGGGRHAFEAMRRGARVTALDYSAADLKDVAAVAGAMIEADEVTRAEWAGVVNADALDLPFPDDSFERVTTMSFYGHLEGSDRERFLAEARRVAPELLVVDAALRDDTDPEEQQERILNDGSSWTVYKRYFTAGELIEELGGGDAVYDGRWFVAVRSPR